MPLQYLGKRWFGLAVGVTRSTIHLASIGVLRDDETGEIHERICRPACRMPSGRRRFPVDVVFRTTEKAKL